MEPSVVRTEPVADNTPQVKSGHTPAVAFYIAVTSLGLALIGWGAHVHFARNEEWLPELCTALGVAIAAPSILSYLYRRYLLDEIKTEVEAPALKFKEEACEKIEEGLDEIVAKHESVISTYRKEIFVLDSARRAGIDGFFSSRRDAIGAFREFLEEEDHNIVIVGSSLLGLLQEEDKEYQDAREVLRRKVSQKRSVHFLLTHPMIADLRAKQEGRPFKAIGDEIIQSLKILVEDWKVPVNDIKLYQGTLTCFGIQTRKAMLLNPYPYMKVAYASSSFIALKGGYFYDHFNDSHFRAWNSEFALSIPGKPTDLESQLDGFAKHIERLLGQAQAGAGGPVVRRGNINEKDVGGHTAASWACGFCRPKWPSVAGRLVAGQGIATGQWTRC